MPSGSARSAAHAGIGMVENAGEMIEIGFDAQFIDERRYALRSDLCRAEHGSEIAVKKIGGARVDKKQLPEIVANRPLIHQLQDGQPDAFVPNLGGLGIVGTGKSAADV